MAKQPAPSSSKPAKLLIKGLIGGITPLLFNPVTADKLAQVAGRVSRGKNPKDMTFDEEAAGKILTNDEDHVLMPVVYILASLIEAGRSVQYKGMAKFSTATSSVIPSLIQFRGGEFLPLLKFDGTPHISIVDDELQPVERDWVTDIRRGRNPKDGVMVAVVRPKFDEWYVPFEIEVNSEGLDVSVGEEAVKQLFRIAGRKVGLADFRPMKRGPFGQFEIVEWRAEQVAVDEGDSEVVSKWSGDLDAVLETIYTSTVAAG